MQVPLFIIGNQRSGTTLLRLMLTCNSKIIIPPECSFIIWLFDKYSNWKPLNSSNFLKVTSFRDDLFECKKFETWHLSKKNIQKEIMLQKPKNYAELCFCFMRLLEKLKPSLL